MKRELKEGLKPKKKGYEKIKIYKQIFFYEKSLQK
jgi:hypothetical protein